jgi:hypothetical protein
LDPRQTIVADYHAALAAERELWESVKGRQPGQPGFDRALWDRWLNAVSHTNAMSKALREAFSTDSKLGDLQ